MRMKISLITICYNSGKTITDTFDSVLCQTYESFEYIVVDGKSQDNTVQIIQEYEKRFANRGVPMNWVSEKDKGLYDAMNKGIRMATGDIIGILNSDDVLATPEAFSKIVAALERDNCDAVYSDLYVMDPETMTKPNRIFIAGQKNYKLGWYPPHPTLYLKREIYEKYGLYETSYKIAADYDFMVRIMKSGVRMTYIPEVLVHMRAGGVSTLSLKAYKKSFDEAVEVLKKNGVKMPYSVNVLRTFVIFKQRFQGMIKAR